MPPVRIQRSALYARRIPLFATTGTWVVPSPQAAPSTGDRVTTGQLVGTSTGNVVRFATQPNGAFFIEVARPGRMNGWVLDTAVITNAAVKPRLVQAADSVKRLVRTVAPKAAAVLVSRKPIAPKRPAPKPTAKPQARPAATGDGAAVLRNIVANDQQTHAHLVKAYYHRAVAIRAGVADNPQLAAQLAAVTASYEARQDKVRKSRSVKVTTGVSKTVKNWMDKLSSMMGLSGIGVLPVLTAPVLLAALVGAGAVGILWLLLHKDEPKSAADAKAAFHLSKEYGAMSPEEQQASDTAVDNAARGGVKEGEDNEKNSLINVIKDNALLIGGALLLVNYAGKTRR